MHEKKKTGGGGGGHINLCTDIKLSIKEDGGSAEMCYTKGRIRKI